jgi:hypothetical protein
MLKDLAISIFFHIFASRNNKRHGKNIIFNVCGFHYDTYPYGRIKVA